MNYLIKTVAASIIAEKYQHPINCGFILFVKKAPQHLLTLAR